MKPATTARMQITTFLATLFLPGDWVETRPLPSSHRLSQWHLARDVHAIVSGCLKLNTAGENVYFGINPRLGFGRRGNNGVAIIRYVWVDFDDQHLTSKTPAEQIVESLKRIADAWLPEPTMVVYSGHGVHCYWRLSKPIPAEEMDRWDELLDALVTTLHSCTGAKGGDRIMRVPGLVNWKAPAALCELVECQPNRAADWEDIGHCVWHSNTVDPPTADAIEKAVADHSAKSPRDDRASIIDTFNATIPVAKVLDAAGYDVVGRQFRRPGKQDRGFSGIIRPNRHGLLVSAHWSSNDRLNDNKFGSKTGSGNCGIHDAFSAFCMLEHAGDVSKAVKAAAELLNIPLPKHKSDNSIIEEVIASIDGETFAKAFFTTPQTAESRRTMRTILARFTTNPKQVERILAMTGEAAAA